MSFSEDTITNNLESIDIQNLPFEINDNDLITSILTPSSLIMYKSNTTVDESIHDTSRLTKNVPAVIDSEKGNIIKEILGKYQDGMMVLSSYKAKGILNSSTRNSLTSVLIKHELQTEPNHQISKSTFLLLAEGIEIIFPTESKDTYYTPYCRTGQIKIPVRGKLYDKYCNLKKEIKKIGAPAATVTCVDDTIAFDDAETHSYPALKKPTGYLLIEIDFEKLYPDKKLLLFTKFDGFIIKLLQYIEKHSIKLGVQETLVLQELKTPSKPGNDIVAALRLIPFLFQPVTLKLDKKRKKCNAPSWRPSKVEQSSAFMEFIANANELKTTHSQKVEKSIQFGTTLQPYVIIIGHSVEANQEDH
ncbi:Uncharacterized protein FWK35_00030375, partial [Aphis craccivora]